MKRLTDRRMKGEGFIPVSSKEYKEIVLNEKPTAEQIYKRLLEIEDILGNDYDLDQLKELVQAYKEGKCAVFPCKPGDKIWVIDRDKRGYAYDFSGCVFIAKSDNYVIASSYDYECEDIKEDLKYLAEQTAADFYSEVLVYPADDCYLDKQSAESALEKMKEDK